MGQPIPLPLSACLASVHTPEGQARLAAVLAARPFPHFEAGPSPDLLVKVDRDGTRTPGRFVDREFHPICPSAVELDRRLAEHAAKPDDVVSWEEIQAANEQKYRQRT